MILLWELIKKNHLQVYLEECKYRVKKIQMPRSLNTELKSNSDSELDSDLDSEKVGSKFDVKVMVKLEFGPDSERDILLLIIFTHMFLFMPIFLRE